MTLYALPVHAYPTKAEMGAAAAAMAATAIRAAIAERGFARLMLAAAPSQSATLSALAGAPSIDFGRVVAFHMDDYIGLPTDAPQGFGNWLTAHFIDLLLHKPDLRRMDTTGDAEAAAAAYAAAMGDEPFDVTLCGLGVNGHLAFNDPPANFTDPVNARVVELDSVSRQQQVDEGHFPTYAAVPTQAVTVTIPRLLNSRLVVASVPGTPKRQAVADTVRRDPDPNYPGTALKTHPNAHLFVDAASAPI